MNTSPETVPLWNKGWYRFAREQASPNYGSRPAGARIDLIVVHSISLPPGEFGNGQIQRLFANQLDWDAHPYFQSIRGLEVSAHFFISRNGELWQFVSCDDRAWHAGESFYRGRASCNDDSIGIELEGLEDGLFESAQYETLASISAALLRQYPVTHLAGHEHIARGRKQDPGAGFDWPLLQRALGLPAKYFPESV
ncbi:MAG TPA: 1,6-anhydro-N-acetylmuramyl-L-alanine amidase AmpD [Polaromonas sp.]|uniref:1,6-anhydro-N-acetylmuramyl-L-alanine amidase AmpD n=1 Tax=Polaromonas sp. TaxID=1869339 RepID=UPI002D484CBC|nr:1,6-anhydro-N-acetylmuramyl-L-alanine amidase AmpD [Polaromonas sp.]HYW58609.1 1,6-anhydro-N-acetylmuramyl-L-alanine amidase AmpD [Polaromonas sp.]